MKQLSIKYYMSSMTSYLYRCNGGPCILEATNSTLIGFLRPTQQEGIHTSYYKFSQLPVAAQVMDFRGNHTTVSFLNQYNFSLSSKYLSLYPQAIQLSPLIKEASFGGRQGPLQKATSGQNEEVGNPDPINTFTTQLLHIGLREHSRML